MKKIITLTESQLVNVIKKIINESAANIEGRKYQIPGDGTILIQNASDKMVKIKMKSSIGDINIAKVDLVPGEGYSITGRSGMSKTIDNETIGKILSFVDGGSPSTSIRKGFITLTLNKI
jgi:hypothetical protein